MRSLRTKLAVLSTLISGVVIIGLGSLSWISAARTFRHSIDLQLEEKAGRIIRNLHPRQDGNRLRDRLEIGFGDEIEEGLRVVRVVDEVNREVLFEGPKEIDWVTNIPQIFREPEHDLPPRPEGVGRPQPPGGRGGRPPRRDLPGHEEGRPPHLEGPASGERPPPHRDGPDEHPNPPPQDEEERDTLFVTAEIDGKDWRLAIDRHRGYSVLIGLELSQAQSELNQLSYLYIGGIPIALCLIGFGGWLIADRACRPVHLIVETASHISAEDLSERIPENPHTDSEIAELTHVLNDMIDRLEKSFFLANRFSADVSHELKTPIAIMQGEVEAALKECEPESEQEKNLTVVREEIQRLKAITGRLMLLAQADVGQLIQKMEVFDLSEEVTAIVEDGSILAKESNVTLVSRIEPEITMKGDPILLRQALLNLIVNAIKYNQADGEVRFFLSKEKDDQIQIVVENTGPGISKEDRERVFHRFHRGDKARSRDVDGFGLGLCLAQEIVRGHGGDLQLIRADEEVTRFEVTLAMV